MQNGTAVVAMFDGEEGTRAEVARIRRAGKDAYSVVVRDVDSGNVVPVGIRIFGSQAEAEAHARTIQPVEFVEHIDGGFYSDNA
jgi:hypothetical protein